MEYRKQEVKRQLNELSKNGVTMQAVAKTGNVPNKTISNFLNGKEGIGELTLGKLEYAIKQIKKNIANI